MSEGTKSQIVTLGVAVSSFKGWDADKEAQEFLKLREPPFGLSTSNYDKIVSFLLLRLRANEPMAVCLVMKGIFGK